MTDSPEGSPPPIRSLLERYEAALVTYAARLTGDVELARDVVQDTFLKLVRQAPSVRSVKKGVPDTALNARTGELTPPGITREACSNSISELVMTALC